MVKPAISDPFVVASAILSLSISAANASAQSPGMTSVVDTIVRAELRHQLGMLAADSMRGRSTPSVEVERTAAYVAAQFRQIGVVGQGHDSVLVRYPIPGQQHVGYAASDLTFFMNGVKNLHGAEYVDEDGSRMHRGNVVDFKTGVRVASPSLPAGLPESASESPVVVAGRHTVASIGASTVVGKIVVYIPPAGLKPSEYQPILDALVALAEGVIIASDADSATFAAGVQAARQPPRVFEAVPSPGNPKRRAWVVYVRDASLKPWLLSGGMDVSQLRSDQNPTARFLAGGFLFYDVYPDTTEHPSPTAPNVIGRLLGSDSTIAKESVVITASMEASSERRGATTATDSTVSSCHHASLAGLLALAHAFAALKPRPRRSLLFLATSGGREGGWGSAALTDALPRGTTIVHLDLDADQLRDTIVIDGVEDVTGAVTPISVALLHPELDLTAQGGRTAFDSPTEAVAFARSGRPTLIVHAPGEGDGGPRQSPADTVVARMARAVELVFFFTRALADSDRPLTLSPSGRAKFLEFQRLP